MNRYFFIFLIMISFLLVSCETKLEQNPQTEKNSEGFYSNEQEIEEAVLGVYATLQFKYNYQIGIPALGELGGEDAYDKTPSNDGGVYGDVDRHRVDPKSSLIEGVWSDGYKGIQRANIVLNQMKDVEFSDNHVKQSREGELKFIRALYYFNFVRLFGDIPLVTKQIETPLESIGQERTDKNEVYTQIISDLEDAIQLLPADMTSSKEGRPIKSTAQMLLGKVYFTLGENSDAKELFEGVVNSGNYDLLKEPSSVFDIHNKLNREIVFAVQYSSGLNGNSEGTDAYRMFNPDDRIENGMQGTKGHGVLKEDFYNLYRDEDKRKGAYVGILGDVAYNNKIAVPTTEVGDSDSDWVVLRYADVLLSLAEIENEDGNYQSALNYLNKIRKRAGVGMYTGNTDKKAVFEAIDLERRKELVWEGHRWFDLLRQGRAQEVLGIDETKLLMPIPDKQIKTDDAIEQNPGY